MFSHLTAHRHHCWHQRFPYAAITLRRCKPLGLLSTFCAEPMSCANANLLWRPLRAVEPGGSIYSGSLARAAYKSPLRSVGSFGHGSSIAVATACLQKDIIAHHLPPHSYSLHSADPGGGPLVQRWSITIFATHAPGRGCLNSAKSIAKAGQKLGHV